MPHIKQLVELCKSNGSFNDIASIEVMSGLRAKVYLIITNNGEKGILIDDEVFC